MLHWISAVFLLLVPGIALSQDWADRPGDMLLSKADLIALTDGVELTFYDDGTSRFSAGGSYSYSYADNGGTAFGRFQLGEDGQICITFRNGFGRCDRYARNGGRLVLLTENGERYPVRPGWE